MNFFNFFFSSDAMRLFLRAGVVGELVLRPSPFPLSTGQLDKVVGGSNGRRGTRSRPITVAGAEFEQLVWRKIDKLLERGNIL